jgi:diguanylate cyclase (GGDEF)-like protein
MLDRCLVYSPVPYAQFRTGQLKRVSKEEFDPAPASTADFRLIRLMIGTRTGTRRTANKHAQSILGYALFATMVLHAVLLLLLRAHPIVASRLATAAAPLLAAFCGLWRAKNVPPREELPWRMLSASMMLWAVGQTIEALIGRSPSALNFIVDGADFFNLIAAFPMLLTLSNTRRTESIQSVIYLDSAQTVLAAVLAWVLLYRMSLTTAAAATAMATVYLAECALLAVSVVVRLATWSTLEERRRIYLLFKGVWLFVPIHTGMNYASSHWDLHAGTVFDLLWSVPFVYAGWQALHMPMTELPEEPHEEPSRGRLLIEGFCPLLMMAAVFALAAAITTQHPVLGLSAVCVLLLIQTMHAGVVQLNYVTAQGLLLKRERELQSANINLEQLSMIDPLTGIPNRRRFDDAFNKAWRRGMRRRKPLALLIIDLDFFKGINDVYGHTYGDECLVSVARVLGKQAARPDDLLARYGGDEFVLLLPDTNTGGAKGVAERMHEAIRLLAAENSASPFCGLLTVTIGIGIGEPEIGADPIALIDVADQALYQAKQMGRNRSCTQSAAQNTSMSHRWN